MPEVEARPLFTDNEYAVIRQCLIAAVQGAFFDLEEFHTIIGFEKSEFVSIAEHLPAVDEDVACAVNNALLNLLYYPHGREADWPKHISASEAEVTALYEKWRHLHYMNGIC